MAGSAQEAVDGADLICTISSAREPVLEGAWIALGPHINAAGASTPAFRELDVRLTAERSKLAPFCQCFGFLSIRPNYSRVTILTWTDSAGPDTLPIRAGDGLLVTARQLHGAGTSKRGGVRPFRA